MPTRFVLVNLRPGVDRAAYERFIQEHDYPCLPELPTIVHYRTHRIDAGTVKGAPLPYDYIEQIVVTDPEAYWRDLDASPRFAEFRRRNPTFVERRLDFWAEVVPPVPPPGGGPIPDGVVQRWETVPLDESRPGLPLRKLKGHAMTAMLVTLYPGIAVTPQQHPEEQLIHMLRGRLRLRVADEARELGPSDVALIPPQVPHAGEALGEEPATYLEVLARPSAQ
ncbi:MAG: cupin domain-containing protein [Armatimonadota bacterium]|nr:cupin domain-containing protein [Armatimonadota bacterium]